jgi:hypothetical protein
VREQALVDQSADDLLEEERVALGALEDAHSQLGRQVLDLEEERDETLALVRRQRIEGDGGVVAFPAAPLRARAQQVGAGGPEEQDRPLDALGQVLEHVQHRAIRPVNVLDDDDERL